MKSRDSLVRLKLFQVNEKRRQVLQLDMMLADFERMATELDNQISVEERKSGITDTNHFAYPTFAKAARLRRDNLVVSQRDLKAQREAAAAGLESAEEERKKAEMVEGRDGRGKESIDVAAGARMAVG
jgi:flagellar export protein FliJ